MNKVHKPEEADSYTPPLESQKERTTRKTKT
jgi:hypothetical protein